MEKLRQGFMVLLSKVYSNAVASLGSKLHMWRFLLQIRMLYNFYTEALP